MYLVDIFDDCDDLDDDSPESAFLFLCPENN